jgi:hypothetical protein
MRDKAKQFASAKRWAAEHPDRVKAKWQRYQAKHRDRVRAACRRYRAKHPDTARAACRRYQAKHPDYSVVHSQRNWQARCVRSARESDARKGRQGTDVDEKFVTDEWHKLQGRCPYCFCDMHAGQGVNRKTDRDAVTLQRMNNTLAHTNANCTLCCATCNNSFRSVPHEILLVHGSDLKLRTVRWCSARAHVGSRLCHPSAFHRNVSNASGFQTWCKVCHPK